MGLITSGDAENTLSNPSQIKDINDKIATTKDTFVNRTAILPERYTEEFGTLLGFGTGTEITTEYYSRQFSITDKRTDNIDFSTFRHSTDIEFLLIHNYKFRLDGALEVDTDEESGITTISGKGTCYPGFEPKLGDIFTYAIPDAQLGIFTITSVNRLTIHQGTHHVIGFKLYSYADEALLVKINTSVSEESYFDKERFLTNDVALLSTQEYVHLSDLKKYRKVLVEEYYNRFYSQVYQSFIRSDDVYDPYIVEFMNGKVNTMDVGVRPEQLYPKLNNYNNSVWGLFESNIHTDPSLLTSSYFILNRDHQVYDTTINSLIATEFILLSDADDDNIPEVIYATIDEPEATPYVFTSAFYSNDTDNMTAIETLVYSAIVDRTVDITTLIDTYISSFTSLTKLEQFNYIPIYIHLIDVAIATIT